MSVTEKSSRQQICWNSISLVLAIMFSKATLAVNNNVVEPTLQQDYWSYPGYSAPLPEIVCNSMVANLKVTNAPNIYELVNFVRTSDVLAKCDIKQTIVYTDDTADGGVLHYNIQKNPKLACPSSHPLEIDYASDGDIDICLKQKHCPTNTVGNPIDCENGQKTQTDVIYQGAGSDPLDYKVHYSSEEYVPETQNYVNSIETRLGTQRNDNYFRTISLVHQNDEGKTYLITYKDGFNHVFYGSHSDTSFESNYSGSGTISLSNTSGIFTQTLLNGTQYTFNQNGQITSKTRKDGRTRSFTYSGEGQLTSVSNHFGDQLSFLYNQQGFVSQLITPDSLSYLFDYDSLGNLVKVTYPDDTPLDTTDNPTLEYLFENANFPKHLTGKIDENGVNFASWSYDSEGRAISSEHGVGIEKVTLDYSTYDQTRVTTYVSDTLSSDKIFHYTTVKNNGDIKKLLKKEETLACESCTVGNREYTYDSQHEIESIVNESGIETFYVNTDGLITEQTEAKGTTEEVVTYREWDVAARRLLSTTKGSLKTSYEYNDLGQNISITQTDLNSNESRVTTNTYTADGLLETTDGPRTDVNDVTQYTYDQKGNLKTIVNALNQVTKFDSHDANGRVQQITDINGVVTTLTYTPRGWLKSTSTNGALTQYEYSPSGQVKSLTTADGITLTYSYDDAQRLIAIVDSLGNRIDYELNAFGNRTNTTIKDEQGQLVYTQSNVFNGLGQLYKTLGNHGQSQTVEYDQEGNVANRTNALTHSMSFSFDALNRLKKQTDAAQGETSFEYNNLDRLTQVTDAEGKLTSYEYNAFGDNTKIVSTDTGETLFTYDSAGNLKTKTDNRGISISFTYDALNRITSISYPDSSLNVTYLYDDMSNSSFGLGRLYKLIDKTGSTEYRYNAFGLVTHETRLINSATYLTEYNYDLVGRLQSVVYPSGAILTYSYDAQGKVESIEVTLNGQQIALANQMRYLPFGPIKSYTLGNGLSHVNSFDNDYRLTNVEVLGLKNESLLYDVKNNITNINGLADSKAYLYDNLDRLTQGSSNTGQYDFAYNLVGDRTLKTSLGVTENYQYGVAPGGSAIPGLVSEFKFESNLDDSVAGSTSSTLNNGAGYTSGKAGEALDVTGSNAHAVLEVPSGVGSNGELTISFWVNLDSAYGKFFILGRGKYWNSDDFSFFCFYRNCGVYGYTASGSRREAKINYTQYEGGWHLWTARLNGGVLEFFIDGQSVASVSGVKNPVDTFSFTAGANYQPRYGMSGSIDEVQIYNRALSDEEINTLVTPQEQSQPSNSKSLSIIESVSDIIFDYDKNGNTIQKGDLTFTYNDANRMSSSSIGGAITNYTYNAKGERSVKVSSGVETHYIFGANGQLIAEADAQGNITKEYVYFAGQPFAQIVGSDIYFYHNSHLGTPELMTDINQNIVWQASYTPFGLATVSVETVENNIRFPGQYFDSESGLHYNYFRDYDPEIGRYIQSDPIGLSGGVNTYGYVAGNPINLVDLLGLFFGPRPNSEDFWNAYLNYGHKAPAVWKIIGGDLEKRFGPKSNSCAARISYGLNYGGQPIDKGWVNKNGDNLSYIVNTGVLMRYLNRKWGKPNYSNVTGAQMRSVRQGLATNQVAVAVNIGHATVLRKGYDKDTTPSLAIGGDLWILPLKPNKPKEEKSCDCD